MQRAMETLEGLFHEKILLYQDLVACLKRERDAVVKTDMDALWEISDEKQSVVSRIEAMRGKILAVLSEAAVEHRMDTSSFDLAHAYSLIPRTHREGFKKAYFSLVSLKGEVRRRSEENRLFIEECLNFLDELIGIIADTGEQKGVYKDSRISTRKGKANLLLHREV